MSFELDKDCAVSLAGEVQCVFTYKQVSYLCECWSTSGTVYAPTVQHAQCFINYGLSCYVAVRLISSQTDCCASYAQHTGMTKFDP